MAQIKLKNVRLSFPDLFEAKPYKPGDTPKFKATFLMAKGSANAKAVEAAILQTATEKWGAKAAAIITSIRNNPNKFCFQDGDTKTYDGYAGQMALGASSKSRPLVIDAAKNLLIEADGKPYAGCYVTALVDIFTYNNSGNGISASLKGVQFERDGDAFSGSAPADLNDFEDISDTGSDVADLM